MGPVRLLIVVLLMQTQWAIAQPGRSPLQQSRVSLDANTEVVKRLATVEDHVKERQWAQAILILQQVATDHGDSLIAVSPRRYLNVSNYCNSILANLPPQGLAVYREKHDAQAKQWLDQGIKNRDPESLKKIVRRAFISTSGDDALYLLGEWAWDKGDFSAARDYWRQLFQLQNAPEAGKPQAVLRYPDSSYPQPAVLARIVLCHIMEGDEPLARDWLAYLAKQYPAAKGDLAGRNGVFTEILADVLKDSKGWQFPRDDGDTPTFAGNAQRDFPHAKPPDVGGLQWELPLPEHNHDPTSSKPGKLEPSLSHFPAIVNNTVYFSDPDAIYAVDLLTGHAKLRGPEEGKIENRDQLGLAAIYRTLVGTTSQNQYRIGVPRFTLTVHENRLFARMGSPITGRVSNSLSSFDSHLVCLDLSKEGKLVWTSKPADVLATAKIESTRLWAFEGTPVVKDERVFVALRQCHPQTEAIVACLDAETGKPRWIRRVASALSNVAQRENFISHLLLTLGDNMVYFMPEFGVLSALDAEDGRMVWAITYDSPSPKVSPILGDPLKQGLTPPLFHHGVIFAAPTDSESILAVSAKTGILLWERKILFERDQIRHVLGVVDDRLVLSGNDLWILNAKTGDVLSPLLPTPGRQPEYDGYGRGVIAGKTILWPTRSRIEFRDLSGQRTKQPEPFPGGNLAVADNLLLVAEPRRLAAYGTFAKARETQRELLSQKPKAALPHLRLAQIEEASQNFPLALDLYGQAIALATPRDFSADRPLKILANENRHRLLLKLGEQANVKGLSRDATSYYQKAVALSFDLPSRAQSLMLLGQAQLKANDPEQAVKTFQSLLSDAAIAKLPLESAPGQSLGQFARDQIAAVIQKEGRAVYSEFDRQAEAAINSRLQQQDLAGVETVLRQFPNAIVSLETRHQLAVLKRDDGDSWSAIRSWKTILKEPLPADIRKRVLWELALTLEAKNYLRPARILWQQLQREFPDTHFVLDGETHTAEAFTRDRLQSALYRLLDAASLDRPLMRDWEVDLAEEASVLFPEGETPGAELASIIVEHQGLHCVDRTTGQSRWQKQLNAPLIWAGYGETHLLLGTAESLFAVTLESGQTLWSQTWNDPDDARNAAVSFHLAQDRVLVLRENDAAGFDFDTGRELWNASPAGQLSKTWLADEKFVVVQTEDPLRILVYDSRSGKPLSEHRLGSVWTSAPVPFTATSTRRFASRDTPQDGFVVSLFNQRIRAFSAYNSQADPNWTYAGATSYANGPPVFWEHAKPLIMLMDADTLIKISPETGEFEWDASLFHSIVSNPRQAIAFDDDSLYAAGGEFLTCLDLKTGRQKWRSPLPESHMWLVRKAERFVAVAPKDSASPNSRMILLDAVTGNRVQELQIPPGILELDFHQDRFVLITKHKLLAWGPGRFSG